MKRFGIILLFLFASLLAAAQNDTVQKVIPGRKNGAAQLSKPYVILISADGFRYDYAEKYKASHLLALAGNGVIAAYMVPSFPSVTFPNHYTIATGLYPAHSGLVNNSFYDRQRKESYQSNNKAKTGDGSWYGGTPLWVLAEQQHMLSASFYWVGSEAPVKGILPTYDYAYNEKIGINKRIKTVADWLELPPESRPHFITFYLPQVDHVGHLSGPESPEVEKQVHFVDSAVYELAKAVKSTGLDVNYIFVSDHGMTAVDTEHPVGIPAAIDTSKFIISGDGTLVELYAKDPHDIAKTYEALKADAKDYRVFLRENMPARLHYGENDDKYDRIGDILLIPNWPKVFNLYGRKLSKGMHGFDPFTVKEMMATFYAWGPAFKKQVKLPPFPNVDIYPLITDILGLRVTEKVDGSKKVIGQTLVHSAIH